MSFENRHWKLPLPNSKSYIRNVLTIYTYLSFLAIYPAWIGSSSDVTAGYGMFAAIVLIPLIPIITFLYAIVMLIRKRYRKWGVVSNIAIRRTYNIIRVIKSWLFNCYTVFNNSNTLPVHTNNNVLRNRKSRCFILFGMETTRASNN